MSAPLRVYCLLVLVNVTNTYYPNDENATTTIYVIAVSDSVRLQINARFNPRLMDLEKAT